MKVVGINFGEINASACLIDHGAVVSAAPEERFIRQKKTKLFPKNALSFVLGGNSIADAGIDAIAQAWNPGVKWVTYNPLISTNRSKREDYFYSLPDHLYGFLERQPGDFVKLECGDDMPPIYFVTHHRCHVANAFFLSSFSESAFLTADWQGELECVTRGMATDNSIDVMDTQLMPHSLGLFYATYTQMLGYQPDNDEWKVMALSAVDIDCKDYEEKILSTVNFLPEGRFELDQSFYTGAFVDQPSLYSEKLYHLLEGRDKKDDTHFAHWQNYVAKAMQNVSEKIVWHMLSDLWEKTRSDNLVVSGGFFMNSVLNGKILKNSRFKKIYISHSPDDVGNSIGAAMYVNHYILKQPRNSQNTKSAVGPDFTSDEIASVLQRRRITFTKLDNPEKTVAEILSSGEVVGLHQGPMEFGDRALGFRSILGDPRDASMKDKINSMIKYRESYRPFAPATLIERASQIFDVPSDYSCPYMERVVMVRNEWKKKIPAVTHFDGSARLQTVEIDVNPYFYGVIKEFESLTGVPVVLNTSFNINGEPIVMSPDDAVSTFFNSGLEYLVMNDFLIEKKKQ